MPNFSRRNLLKGIAGASATVSLSACGILFVSQFDATHFNLDCNSGPIITDAHAHFFNASDLNFARYLTGPVLNDAINKGDTLEYQTLLKATATFVQLAGNSIACSAKTELFWLKQPSPSMSLLSDIDSVKEKENLLKLEIKTVADNLFKYKSDDNRRVLNDKEKALRDLAQAYEAWQDQELVIYSTDKNKSLNSQDYIIPFEYESFSDISDEPLNGLSFSPDIDKKTQNDIKKMRAAWKGYLEMFRAILSPRSTNIHLFLRRYSKKLGPSVHNVMAVTCDFDYFLGPKAYTSSQSSQIKLYSKLAELTKGYVVPVLGVNPYKLAADNDYENLVKDALQNKGFKGVKLYPTIGYAADGRESEIAYNPKKYNSADIKGGLWKLYKMCQGKYFVMSHAQESKGVSRKARMYSNPNYWASVLAAFPNLHLNFGHLGGKNVANRQGYLALMTKYKNAYGDLGYQPYLENDLMAKVLINEMRTASRSGSYSAFDKVMFGSDWFMLLQEKSSLDYLNNLYNTFDKLVQSGFLSSTERDKIFRHNALSMSNTLALC
ncbi:amidohydrolase family protein [Glaciecola petra]|uniref:Amidohydrolase family protein n=1 Tax=Glaciecola petra TaxID=3075602 RepID=A0ABU2ZQH8_9ALTE|nr:amidohydrolase family protein [Aestuariibacter sp. P117]MDT0594872.1 amidohydrolase family protein [Aestuariibacter sp. P117]